jgi:hypothetical protein
MGIRGQLYGGLRISNDLNAAYKGKLGKRLLRRMAGRATGRALGRLFR